MGKQVIHSRKFLSSDDIAAVEQAVERAEGYTSAEIKVVVVQHGWRDIRDRAARLFRKYELEKTTHRNGVMILIVTANREFLVYGDKGIHEKVGQDFWNDARDKMAAKFAGGQYADGICEGVKLVGERLAHFFPLEEGDRNELCNEVVFTDN